MDIEDSKTLKGIIRLNESPFLDENEEFEWNLVTARNRLRETLAEDGQIYTLEMKNINCSTGVLQELMQLLPRFISDNGLSEFVQDRLKKDAVIGMGAMRRILEETHELRKLRNQVLEAIYD